MKSVKILSKWTWYNGGGSSTTDLCYLPERSGQADGTVNFAKEIEPDILEIGYVLHPDLWGQGLMPEAVSALVDFGFTELELHKIEIAVYDHNPQSRRVAEKLGFSLEARLRKRKKIDGYYQDKLIFGLLREEREETS